MDMKTKLCKKAVDHFLGDYNCAQSVLLTMFEHWNGKNELIPKIATAFGAGIGRCGSVCGALTGGVMAIGVRYGDNEPSPEKRRQSYELAQTLYRRFEKAHGTVFCRELISYDLSNPKELETARKEKVFEEKCPDYLRTVVRILADLTEPAT